jgi:hypothetical protein
VYPLREREQGEGAEVSSAAGQESALEVMGEPVTPEDVEAKEWAAKAASSELHNLHESLKHLVTLTVAMLAASSAFMNQTGWFVGVKVAVALCLFTALGCALYGWLPLRLSIDTGDYASMRAAMAALRGHRTLWLRLSVAALCVTLAVFVSATLIWPQ